MNPPFLTIYRDLRRPCLVKIRIQRTIASKSSIKRGTLPLWNVTYATGSLPITGSLARRETPPEIPPAAKPLTTNSIISRAQFKLLLIDERVTIHKRVIARTITLVLPQSRRPVHAGALKTITRPIEEPDQSQIQSTGLRMSFPPFDWKTEQSGAGDSSTHQVVPAQVRTGETTKGDGSSRSRGANGHGIRRQGPVGPGSR